jgi:hypothetical protein
MVSTAGTIFATDYNNIRSTVNSILNGSWGENLVSSAVVSNVNTITALQLKNLYIDLQRVVVHQTGSLSSTIAVPSVGLRIGADTAFAFNPSTGALTAVTDGTKMGVNDYIQVGTDISNFNPAVSGFPVGNLLPGTAITSTRSTAWGGAGQVQSIQHVVTVTFSSAIALSQYFSAGGEIRFFANLTGGSGSKSTDWAALLSAIGTVKFNKYTTTANSGTSANKGMDDLTGTYQQLLVKTGSGVYADNDYTIEGRADSTTVLRFQITFNDGDVGEGTGIVFDPIDESVNGTLTSSVQSARPSSSFVYDTVTYGVSRPAPTVVNVTLLE